MMNYTNSTEYTSSGTTTLSMGKIPSEEEKIDVVLIVALSLFGVGVILLCLGFVKVILWCKATRHKNRYSSRWLRHLEHKRSREEYAIRTGVSNGTGLMDAQSIHSQFGEWSAYLNDALQLDDDSTSQIKAEDIMFNDQVSLSGRKTSESVNQETNSYVDVTKTKDSDATTVSYISDGIVSVVVEGRGVIDGYANPDISASKNSLNVEYDELNEHPDTSTGKHEPTAEEEHEYSPPDLANTTNIYPYDNNNNIINIREDANKSTPAHQLAAKKEDSPPHKSDSHSYRDFYL